MSNTGSLAPVGQQQFFDDTGVVLSGGLLNWYVSGTSTPSAPYQDAALTTPWSNPITLTSGGRVPGGIYLDPAVGSYKLIVTNSGGTAVGNTIDPITATNAGTAGLGEIFDFNSASSSPITGTSYPSGATFDKLQPGTAVWSVDSATLPGTYVLECVGLQTTAGTLTVALVNLTDGAPDTPIATCAITSATGQLIDSTAIPLATAGTTKQYGIKTKVSANTGFLISAKIRRTA